HFTSSGRELEVSFSLTQVQGNDQVSTSSEPAFPKVAYACGSRTFLRSAAACLDTTEMPLAGKLTVKSVSPVAETLVDHAEVQGKLLVDGRTLDQARIEIESGELSIAIDGRGTTFAFLRGDLQTKPGR